MKASTVRRIAGIAIVAIEVIAGAMVVFVFVCAGLQIAGIELPWSKGGE